MPNDSKSVWVVFALAVALGLGFILATIAILYVSLHGPKPIDQPTAAQLTQIITSLGGGIVGVLGTYLGYHAGINAASNK